MARPEQLTGLPAPAKLNLFLHVTGRRADGYHLLETLFTFLDHGDRIDLHLRRDARIHRLNALQGVPEEEDLCVRAARLLARHTGCRLGVDLRVEKTLPMGGGLGGGSSDAATVLIGLNRLWDLHLTRAELARLGLQLGADVPVFVHGESAFAQGVGEILHPVRLPAAHYLVLVPPVPVATAGIFSAPELTRDTPQVKMFDFPAGFGRNDLEPVVCQRYPEVKKQLEFLRQQAPGARMTGSGCCVFAAFEDAAAARQCQEGLPSHWVSFVASGLQQHPLACL